MKKFARRNSTAADIRSSKSKPETALARRTWPVALAWAGVLVGVSVILSAVVNPLFGRFVHWDWMAGLAPTLFIVVAFSLRRRWV